MIVELIAAAALANAASSGQSNWTVSEASPGVSVLHLGASHMLARGGKVVPGDTVITTVNARAVLVNGQQYAIVAPNSRLEIAEPDPADGLTQVIEHLGNAVFSVRKGAAPHFVVRTPYLAAVVKGTTFSVTVDPTGFVITGERLETSVPGVFAVGDVRSGSVKRVGASIGEGAQVVAAIHAYLAAHPEPSETSP